MPEIKRNSKGQFIKGSHYKLKRYKVDKKTGCWNWLLHTIKGYGRTRNGYKSEQAHRLFFENKYGKIPDNMTLAHLCRNRKCVNPSHLEIVTRQVNVQRASKLNPEKVKEIRSRWENEEYNQRELSAFYGVGPWQISRIVNLKRWNNV